MKTWFNSPRGAGYIFGEKVVDDFMEKNGISLILRAHQIAKDGYTEHFGGKVVTVWSAPCYCGYDNVASVLEIDENLQKVYKVFERAPREIIQNEREKLIGGDFIMKKYFI